jgi:Lactate dehydrogenase and related dehydrogenases
MKEKVFITREIPKVGIELLKKYFQVEVNKLNRDLTQFELLRKLKGVSAVVSMLSNRFDREFIRKLEGLKVISNYAVGYNNIDVSAATENGIIVTNTPGVLTDATADLTLHCFWRRRGVSLRETALYGQENLKAGARSLCWATTLQAKQLVLLARAELEQL